MDDGALVGLLGKLYIGYQAGSSGTVIIDGGADGNTLVAISQERTSIHVPVVGFSGSGTLIVTNGGEFEAKNDGDRINLEVAKEAGSKGLVVIGSPAGQTVSAPGTLDVDEVSFCDGDGTLLFNHSDTSGEYEWLSFRSVWHGLLIAAARQAAAMPSRTMPMRWNHRR